MKKTVFIKNAAILTVSSAVLRLLGIVFKIWVAKIIGSEGIGLYTLVFSVYIFVSGFTSTGITTAVTCLCAKAQTNGKNQKTILARAIEISTALALFLSLLVYFSAPFIAKTVIGAKHCATAIKITAVILPFIGISACFKGFFISAEKAAPCAWSQILEQTVRIGLSLLLLSRFGGGSEKAAALLFCADAAAEIVCCAFLYARYRAYSRKTSLGLHKPKKVIREITKIAFPLTLGKYLSSVFRTTENMLVPRLVSKGTDRKSGISVFGNIKGMALPILLFPAGLLLSVTTLLVPELSRAKEQNRRGVLRTVSCLIIKLTVLFSVFLGVFFAFCGKEIGLLLYKNEQVGTLLCLLSPIVPFMYLDLVCDGMLKGLDCQNFCFKVGIADSAIRVILILILLKKFGVPAFIGIMYFSNFFTCLLDTGKLAKETNAQIDVSKTVFLPLCAALIIIKGATLLLGRAALPPPVYITLCFTVSAAVYTVFLRLIGAVSFDDARAFLKSR